MVRKSGELVEAWLGTSSTWIRRYGRYRLHGPRRTVRTSFFCRRRRLPCLPSSTSWPAGSEFVFPEPQQSATANREDDAQHRRQGLTVRDPRLRDPRFRRTASTHLHETGFNSDVIEKALGHEQKGVRGVYNKAACADQRRELLRWWATFVEAQIEDGGRVVLGRFGVR